MSTEGAGLDPLAPAEDAAVAFCAPVADGAKAGSGAPDWACRVLAICSLSALISPESFCIADCPLGVLADTHVVQSFSCT